MQVSGEREKLEVLPESCLQNFSFFRKTNQWILTVQITQRFVFQVENAIRPHDFGLRRSIFNFRENRLGFRESKGLAA